MFRGTLRGLRVLDVSGLRRPLHPRATLLAAALASAVASVFGPVLHLYLTRHEEAAIAWHHLNNLGTLLLMTVVFAGLRVVARTVRSDVLLRAAALSLAITAVNAAGNEMQLVTGFRGGPDVITMYAALYTFSSALFVIAFVTVRFPLGHLTQASVALWVLAFVSNALALVALLSGDEELFWFCLNAGVALGALIHAVFALLFMTIARFVAADSGR